MTHFDILPPAQQRRELQAADARARGEVAARVAAIRRSRAVAAKRPGLDRPGERQLHRPPFTAVALMSARTAEDAAAVARAAFERGYP